MDDLEQWRQQRNKALIALDLDWARTQGPNAPDDFTVLAAMHKARYDCCDIPAELRHESGNWLRARGMSRLGGLELLPEGVLPLGAP